MTTHGMSSHHGYGVWASMLSRCTSKTNAVWKNYGGRGIKIHPRWTKFENFWSDMGDSYARGLTLERRNNDAGYEPLNCYWATRLQQGANKRNNRRIHTPWGEMTVNEASRRSGIKRATLLHRVVHQDRQEDRLFDLPAPIRSPYQTLFNGESMTLGELARRTGVRCRLLKDRIVGSGWTPEKAVHTSKNLKRSEAAKRGASK